MQRIYNSGFEIEPRIILIADTYPLSSFTEDLFVAIDFMAVYCGEFVKEAQSLHGDNGFKFSEITARATSDALNYSIRSSCMVCCEVEWLYKKLVELENGTLTDEIEISNIEPDFEYTLYPSKNGQYYMDWKFNLWNGGALTCNSFTIMFGEEDIMKLREYLNDVMTK